MLALVVADRDDVGLVEQDVAGHQDRVGEEAGGDELLPLALLLELRHPAELAVARDRAEQPGRLGVRRDVALARTPSSARGRARSRRASRRGRASARAGPAGSYSTVIECRSTMQKNASPLLLRRRVLAEAADQVAEVLVAGGLDAARRCACRSSWRNRAPADFYTGPMAVTPDNLDALLVARPSRRSSSPSGRTRRAREAALAQLKAHAAARLRRRGARSSRPRSPRSRPAARSCSRPATAPSRSTTSRPSRSARS